MNIKKGDMVSIKQDFIDRNNRYEYNSRDIWEVKEVYNIGGVDMKNVERVNALNKMLLNANVVAYGAMVDLIKRTGRLDLDMNSVGHIDDFPAEIRVFTDNGLICLSITSVYLSGEDNLMVDGYDDDNDKVDGVNVYYDQISEVVYLAKIILEEMEGKDHGESS